MQTMPRFVPTFAFSAFLIVMMPAIAHASSKLEQVIAQKELRVCIWPDYYGITYRNPKTRNLSGIDIDLSQLLAADLGAKLTYVDSSFPDLISNLEKNVCDIAMHAVGITAQRSAKLQFTQPYLRSDLVAITTKTNTTINKWADIDQPGRVVVVQAGTVMEPTMQAALKQARLVAVKPPLTREQEILSGRGDVFMTDVPYSKRMLDLTDWARAITPPSTFHTTDYAYALAQGDPSLRDRVNRFLQGIKKDGRLLQLAKKHKLDSIAVTD